ncbi:MAG: hypothetical protein KC680_04260, partial [Candidatus Peregrinibacteria bacterium]|nr:hypothetical protein [Candidatus Peregrinibacteria bacterium]
ERAFMLCSQEELAVHAITLTVKDPDEAAQQDPEGLRELLSAGGKPYLDLIIEDLRTGDVQSTAGKREALKKLLPLLNALASSVVKEHYISRMAALLSTTETALKEDMQKLERDAPVFQSIGEATTVGVQNKTEFSSAEIALGILLSFPHLSALISELIEPEEPFAAVLYHAFKEAPNAPSVPEEYQERASILMLYCEHHGFSDWGDSLATQEIRKNCTVSNRNLLRKKQLDIAQKLQKARLEGNNAEESKLSTQYQQILKLNAMVHKS